MVFVATCALFYHLSSSYTIFYANKSSDFVIIPKKNFFGSNSVAAVILKTKDVQFSNPIAMRNNRRKYIHRLHTCMCACHSSRTSVRGSVNPACAVGQPLTHHVGWDRRYRLPDSIFEISEPWNAIFEFRFAIVFIF